MKQVQWYSGGNQNPERVIVTDGAEFPDTDSAGHKLYADHHWPTWEDARAEIVKQHAAGVRLCTQDVIRAEDGLQAALAHLGIQCKKLFAAEELENPEDS